MNSMRRLSSDQRGAVDPLLPALIAMIVFFLGAAGFGIWAFMSRSHYKNDTDKIVASAVTKAEEKTSAAAAAHFAEEEKKPYDLYIGPAAFGNITVNYPKTWSAYSIETQGSGGSPVSAYFHPNYVPNIAAQSNSFALRVELVRTPYDSVMTSFRSALQQKKLTVAPYVLPKVPTIVGSRIDGQLTNVKQGTMIVLPLRDMTLKIWTESNDFKADLETHILPNLSFQP